MFWTQVLETTTQKYPLRYDQKYDQKYDSRLKLQL